MILKIHREKFNHLFVTSSGLYSKRPFKSPKNGDTLLNNSSIFLKIKNRNFCTMKQNWHEEQKRLIDSKEYSTIQFCNLIRLAVPFSRTQTESENVWKRQTPVWIFEDARTVPSNRALINKSLVPARNTASVLPDIDEWTTWIPTGYNTLLLRDPVFPSDQTSINRRLEMFVLAFDSSSLWKLFLSFVKLEIHFLNWKQLVGDNFNSDLSPSVISSGRSRYISTMNYFRSLIDFIWDWKNRYTNVVPQCTLISLCTSFKIDVFNVARYTFLEWKRVKCVVKRFRFLFGYFHRRNSGNY